MGIINSHHAQDTIALDFGSQPLHKNSYPSKDKLLESRRFPLFLRTDRRNRSYAQPSPSTRRWFYRLFLVVVAFLFIFGYLPFFHLISRDETMDLSPSTLPRQPSVVPVSRDQIILYRIIGNDLPPRHKEGQTLSNLRFILEHESSFPNTRKLFILNRIADPTNEEMIIQLLNSHQMDYVRLPFDAAEYESLDFRLEDFPESDFLHSDWYRRFSKVSKLRTLDYTYHDKNVYAMNNNGGRNAALRHGRALPNVRWIMPFDGNCFLSKSGFEEISNQLERYGDEIKYFVVPMARLLNNTILLETEEDKPKAPEEPQIIFRFDATEEYNMNMRYGRRSKLELLWRLGALENRRLNRPTVPWEPVERPYSKDKGNFLTIGWVFRLFSGNQQQEENKKEASSIRAFNRLLAIQLSLDNLDESLARRSFRPENLFLYNEREMTMIRYAYWSKDPAVSAAMSILEERAETILEYTQTRIVPSEPIKTPEEDQLDFEDYANTPLPENTAENLGSLSQNVTIMTLANYFLGNEAYGKCAANMIRVNFLNEYVLDQQDEYSSARVIPDSTHLLDFLSDQGYSFPSMSRMSRALTKRVTMPILNTSDLTKTDMSSMLDSIRLLSRMQALTHKEYLDLQAIMAEFLEYLVTSPTGIHLAQMNDYRGVLYDLQVTALAAFTDDVRLFLRVANRCRMRIGRQFNQDGSQPLQKSSTHARFVSPLESESGSAETSQRVQLHYETMNLQYWTLLARGIQNSGVGKDIWHYTSKAGGSISHAVVAHLKQQAAVLPQLSSADGAFVQSRLRPLAYMAQAAFGFSARINKPQQSIEKNEDWRWLERYVSTFGTQWTEEVPDAALNSTDDQSIVHHIMALISEDQHKGRLGVPPFWMLSIA
ncbi:alginate lyase-domain-containing protein [Phycomyces nitens]|nr:alginate lyase-domain-containing protein [Phycomyces nitens]